MRDPHVCQHCGHEFGYLHIGTPDIQEVPHNCEEVLAEKRRVRSINSQISENHMDANRASDCPSEGDGIESGGCFIVGEGLSGTGTDVPSTGTSPTDSKQLGRTPDLSKPATEAGTLIERIIFDKPIVVKNGEVVSINRGTFEVSINGVVVAKFSNDIVSDGILVESSIKRTLAGNGSNFNIKRAFKEFKLLELVEVDYASIGIGAYNSDIYPANEWNKVTYPNSSISLSAKELEQGIAENAERTARRLARTIDAEVVAAYRVFLEATERLREPGTHRRNFAAQYQGNFPSWSNSWGNDANTGGRSGDLKAEPEVARDTQPTDENVHYLPRNPEEE